MKWVLGILALLTVAACGPTSPEVAAKMCEERARAATGPTGSIGIGVSNGGKAASKVELGVTTDFLFGRDPYQVYDSCVRQKSGQGPIRPLVLS